MGLRPTQGNENRGEMIFDGGCPRFAKLTWVFSHRAVIPGERIFDGVKPRDLLFFINLRSRLIPSL
jgi:hypothetical protein